MSVEKPDRILRMFVLALLLWSGVAVVVFAMFELIFPAHAETRAELPTCTPTVTSPYDPVSATDLAAPVLAAVSACGSSTRNTVALFHAYLDGAELDGAPTRPSPPVDAALRARGAALYKQHCANCHGASGDGRGPNACVLEIPPAIHQRGVYALRTTEHEALPTDEDLFRTITRGIHGTAMPPWFALPEADRWALVAHVKSLSTQFAEDTAPPSLQPEPPPAATPARIAHGRELYTTGGCSSCHGANGHGDGPAAVALAVRPRNFTGGRFHRGSSVDEIHMTLLTGLDGTPMGSFANVMSADDLWDVAMFVHTLAPPTIDRPGLRCPEAPRELDRQEVFAIRNAISTLR